MGKPRFYTLGLHRTHSLVGVILLLLHNEPTEPITGAIAHTASGAPEHKTEIIPERSVQAKPGWA